MKTQWQVTHSLRHYETYSLLACAPSRKVDGTTQRNCGIAEVLSRSPITISDPSISRTRPTRRVKAAGSSWTIRNNCSVRRSSSRKVQRRCWCSSRKGRGGRRMRQQETAVSNKIRMPFAALATSQIERANIMCLACCSSSRKGCWLIFGGAWHGVGARAQARAAHGLIPAFAKRIAAWLKMKKTSGLPGASRPPGDRLACE